MGTQLSECTWVVLFGYTIIKRGSLVYIINHPQWAQLERQGTTQGITQMSTAVLCTQDSTRKHKRGAWFKQRWHDNDMPELMGELRRICLKRWK